MLRDKREELEAFTVDSLKDLKGYYDGYGCDLHNEIFNTNYYIIGTYQATEWLGSDVFEAIEVVQEYERNNFGEVTTDISIPEKLVNMYVYIIGEEILNNSSVLNDCYDRRITEEDIDNIINDIE